MFDQLPAELRLKTFTHLTVRDLRNAQLVSRAWHEFFVSNESSIYRHAAVIHWLAHSSAASLAEVKLASPRGSMLGVESWKDLIKRRFQIETNWQGRTQPRVKEFRPSGDAVHRIKIDEDAGYIVTTSRDGGLRVTDLYRNEILWSLPEDYVREQAHCEYGDGYLIFDRIGNFKEVWRRACDFLDVTVPTVSLPDEMQLKASADAAELHHSDTLRGHFLPWALIEMPAFGSAFRFVYPTLLVAAENQAFLWDISTARSTIIIHDTQTPADGAILGRINYVEMNERYVIICGSQQLRIFSKNPQGALLYHILASRSTYANSSLELVDEQEHGNRDMVLIPRDTSAHANDVTATPQPLPPALADVMRFDDFVAAHITPCGSVLVALLSFGRVVIVSNLERVVNGEVALADAALEVNLHSSSLAPSSIYLALEEGRIAVATRGGIYVITLNTRAHGIIAPKDTNPHSQKASTTPFPDLAVCQAVCFNNPTALYSLSCLQMTATGLFITWKPHSPRLSVMLQSPGHQPSPDALQQSVLVNDDEWDVESHSDDPDSVGFVGDPLAAADQDELMSAGNVVDLAFGSTADAPIVQMAGPSSQSSLGGQEDSDDSFPDLQSVSDSSSEPSSDDHPQNAHPISTVVCIDFLPE